MPMDNAAKQQENTPLAEWVKKISQQDMPIFDRTAREATGVAGNQSSSAAQLARVVLNDPAFTARVLRMANSALYNHGNHTISTVSRAVVILGFEAIKSICITVAALDSLTANPDKTNPYKDRVLKEIARSFHAAVQARKLAESQHLRCVEEVFIAALLHHLGEMAFWCFAEDIGRDLEQAMSRKGAISSRVEKTLLGFSFNELTQELCDEWKLGELLKSSLIQAKTKDARITHVLLGHDIAQCVEKGWSEPGVNEHLTKLAKNLKMDYAAFKELVYSGANEARDIIKNYGAEIVSQFIPLPKEFGKQDSNPASAHKPLAEELQKQPKYYDTNAQLQLKIMREVSDLMAHKFDINLVLETILEGVYRAVGLDRVMFSLLNPRRTELKPKHAFGWQVVDKHKFAFTVTLPTQNQMQDPTQDWLSLSLLKKTPLWVKDIQEPQYAKGMTKTLESLCGGSPFFLFPVVAKNEAIGLFYADRHASGRELSQELYESFEHFCRQANLAFVLATQK